ncbi:FtsX-like permease family protein [Candidatus Harpocratesius sp.]
MQKIYKAVFRDLYFNFSRSFITYISLLIVIAFPIALLSTAPSMEYSINNNNEEYKLAQLDIRFTGTPPSTIDIINETIKDTLGKYPDVIASRLISNTKLFHKQEWYQLNVVGINPEEELALNKIKIQEGTWNISGNEAIIVKSFAEHLNVTIGDSLFLFDHGEFKNYYVEGIVEAIDSLSYDLSQEGLVYIEETDFRALFDLPAPLINDILIFFATDISKDEILSCSEALRDEFVMHNIPYTVQWHTLENGLNAALSDTLNLTSKYLNIAVVQIIIIIGLVIYIITKRYAVEQRKQTGMLYSFGFSSRQIMKAFLLRTIILLIIAIVSGIVLSWFLLNYLSSFLGSQWGLIVVYPAFSNLAITEVIALACTISLFFTYLAAKENVSLTPYEAIRGKKKEFEMKPRRFLDHFIQKLPLQGKLAIRNISRNRLRSIFTALAFCFSVILSFSLMAVQTNLNQTQDDFFQNIQWDIKGVFTNYDFNETIFDNLSKYDGIKEAEPILETYIQPYEHYNKLAMIVGIVADSELMWIDLQEGSTFSSSNSSECIMSQYLAEHLGYSIGDKFSFVFQFKQINFTVVGLTRDMATPLSVYIQLPYLEEVLGFMPINGMVAVTEEGQGKDVLNYLNMQDSISMAVQSSTLEKRMNVIISTQTLVVEVMAILGFNISFLSIFSTATIIILEREREYSLQRIFGFSKYQVIMQILIELGLLALISLVFGYVGGNIFEIYLLNLLSSIFFKIDAYFKIANYLILLGFTFLTVSISITPQLSLLQQKSLPKGIMEN